VRLQSANSRQTGRSNALVGTQCIRVIKPAPKCWTRPSITIGIPIDGRTLLALLCGPRYIPSERTRITGGKVSSFYQRSGRFFRDGYHYQRKGGVRTWILGTSTRIRRGSGAGDERPETGRLSARRARAIPTALTAKRTLVVTAGPASTHLGWGGNSPANQPKEREAWRSPAVNLDSRARGEHPVMSAQCPQRLPVPAGGLLALLGLSLAESRPGDRLGGLASVTALQDLAGRRGNLRRRLLTRHVDLTSWLDFGAPLACATPIDQGPMLHKYRRTSTTARCEELAVGEREC